MEMYEVYKSKTFFCEEGNCERVATVEWTKVDYEEGSPEVYYTFRCELHPADNDYEPNYLDHVHDFSESKHNNECACGFKLEREPIDV